MVSLLCRKKNTNLYHKEYDNHAVYEPRGYFFYGLPPANSGLRSFFIASMRYRRGRPVKASRVNPVDSRNL